jgi:D-sedoheptulose 7-phosphate isomerase
MNTSRIISSHFEEHINLAQLVSTMHATNLENSANKISESLAIGGTLFFCGNGGSAADSQHLAAEFVGRFKNDRPALRSIALTTDTSVISCVANDYDYDLIFARQLEALGRDGDVLVAISTSGNSQNVLKILRTAREQNIYSIALLGHDGGKAKEISDLPIIVPCNITARIQEMHCLIGHILCDLVERQLGYA